MGRTRIPPREIPKNVRPSGKRCIMLTLPDDDEWEHIAYSTLYDQLALVWTNWKPTGDRTGSDLCIAWRAILRTWKKCPDQEPVGTSVEIDQMDNLIQVIREGGQCVLQYRCCIDDPWITLATVQQAQNAGQPGSGPAPQPAPGGGTQCYHLGFNAANTCLLPTIVSTGDQITIQAATGAGADNASTSWYCDDGNQFFAGACVGGQFHSGGDPAPGLFHGSLIMFIAGTYYTAVPGTIFTVPGGVTNAQVVFQSNRPLSGASGSFTMDVCVTNNAVSTWTQTLDFMLNSNLFVLDPFGPYTAPYIGTWVAASGWNGSINNPDPVAGTSTVLRIKRNLTGVFTITDATVYFHTDQTQDSSGRGIAFGATALTIPDGSGDQVYHDSGSHVGPYSLQIDMGTAHSGGGATGTIILTKLVFSGTGTNPFL